MNQSIKKRSTYIFSLKSFFVLRGGADGATKLWCAVRMERLDL